MVLIKNHVSKLLFAILFLSYSTVWASTRTHNDWLVKTCADNIELRLYESAYYFCNQALIKDSSNIEALYYRGISLMELGKEEAAQLDFTRLIQKDPMDYEALVQRANVYRRLGQFTLALADANKALILNPEFALSYSSRGAILQNMDRHGEAIADFTKAIELIPNEPRLYVARGIAYSKINHDSEAFADYSVAMKIFTDNTRKPGYRSLYLKDEFMALDAYYNRGLLYVKNNRFSEALSDFNRSIEMGADLMWLPKRTYSGILIPNPKYLDLFYQRGQLYTKLNRHMEAIADFKTIMALNHSDRDYSNYLDSCFECAMSLSKLNRISEAVVLFGDYIKYSKDKNNPKYKFASDFIARN